VYSKPNLIIENAGLIFPMMILSYNLRIYTRLFLINLREILFLHEQSIFPPAVHVVYNIGSHRETRARVFINEVGFTIHYKLILKIIYHDCLPFDQFRPHRILYWDPSCFFLYILPWRPCKKKIKFRRIPIFGNNKIAACYLRFSFFSSSEDLN